MLTQDWMSYLDKELFTFEVLWRGWDCDCTASVMEKSDGSRYLRMTNHGTPCVANIEVLADKISEYNQAIENTKKAIQLLTEKTS